MEKIISHLDEALVLLREYKTLNSRYQYLKDLIRLLKADKEKITIKENNREDLK